MRCNPTLLGLGLVVGIAAGACDESGEVCPVGGVECACTLGGACDPGLICDPDGTCVDPESESESESESDSGTTTASGGSASGGSDSDTGSDSDSDSDSDSGSDSDTGSGGGALRVFVTSSQYDADFGGLSEGDALCQLAADAAGLDGIFRAWLSTDTVDAIDHIEGEGPWDNLYGERVFNNRANLATSPLVPIVVDENRNEVDPYSAVDAVVWTATGNGGRREGNTCANWTTNDPDLPVHNGSAYSTSEWTDASIVWCDRAARLYCFES